MYVCLYCGWGATLQMRSCSSAGYRLLLPLMLQWLPGRKTGRQTRKKMHKQADRQSGRPGKKANSILGFTTRMRE